MDVSKFHYIKKQVNLKTFVNSCAPNQTKSSSPYQLFFPVTPLLNKDHRGISNSKLLLWGLVDGGLFGDVESVQEFTDILVLDRGGLLDSGGGFGDELDIISVDVELIFHCLRDLDGDSLGHRDTAQEFLPQEVSHLELSSSLHNGAVDGEMGVGGTQLVAESERNSLKRVDLRGRQVGHTFS